MAHAPFLHGIGLDDAEKDRLSHDKPNEDGGQKPGEMSVDIEEIAVLEDLPF